MGRGLLEELKNIGQIDIEQVRRFRDLLLGIAQQAVVAAQKALVIPVIGLAIDAIAATALFLYMRAQPSPPRWPLFTCAGLLAIPSVVLLLYCWILMQVFRVPEAIAQLSDSIFQAIHACQRADLTQDDPAGGFWQRRARTLFRFGRVAWDMRRVLADQAHTKASGPIQAATLMAVPLFWVGLVGALVLSVVAAVLVPLVCLLHYLLA